MSITQLRRLCPTLSLLAVLALAGCSGSEAAANAGQAAADAAPATSVAQPRAPARDQVKGRTMSASTQCGSTQIERSTCMIELILADLKANYPEVGGGGITSIKAGVGMSYSVALPQEERTDIFTYEFEVRGDQIAIKNKKESTESY